MPTPFYHLRLGKDLLLHPAINGELGQFLHSSRWAFLFGNTAPDVQVVTGQRRQITHFFDLPIQQGDPQPWKLLLGEYPQLADVKRLPVPHAAFVAGYLCHLQADWMWVKEIFAPVFGPYCSWSNFEERLYLHNVLRAYLDVRISPGLLPGLESCLHQAEPAGWLPFVEDRELIKWRDILLPQLHPGAASQTVQVFSSRQGISTPEFQALVDSDERMQREVFIHLPLEEVERYHQRVLEANIKLLAEYLAGYAGEVVMQNLCDEKMGAQS